MRFVRVRSGINVGEFIKTLHFPGEILDGIITKPLEFCCFALTGLQKR
jgi:hypothetical protein